MAPTLQNARSKSYSSTSFGAPMGALLAFLCAMMTLHVGHTASTCHSRGANTPRDAERHKRLIGTIPRSKAH